MGKSNGENRGGSRRKGKWDKKIYRSGIYQARMMDETDVLLWYERGKALTMEGSKVSETDKMRQAIIEEEIQRRGLKKPNSIRKARVVDIIIQLRSNNIYAQEYAKDIEKGLISDDGKQAYSAYLKLREQGK